MARTPPAILAWASWLLAFSSFAILLGGISASQRFCGRSSADSVTISGAAGYFANSGCSTFYRYTWFIVWYQWAMVIIVPIVLSMGAVHKWRYGIIALLLPVTYLLQNTA